MGGSGSGTQGALLGSTGGSGGAGIGALLGHARGKGHDGPAGPLPHEIRPNYHTVAGDTTAGRPGVASITQSNPWNPSGAAPMWGGGGAMGQGKPNAPVAQGAATQSMSRQASPPRKG